MNPDDEVEKLREQVKILQKKAGINLNDLEAEGFKQTQEQERERFELEQEKQRQEKNLKRKQDEDAIIQKTFSEQIGKSIKLFYIQSDKTGRKADFINDTPIVCSSCGSVDIPRLKELSEKTAGLYIAYQKDPGILAEYPQKSVGWLKIQCSTCNHEATLHFQVCI